MTYFTKDFEIWYKHLVLQAVLCIKQPATYFLSVPLFLHFSFTLTKFSQNFLSKISQELLNLGF